MADVELEIPVTVSHGAFAKVYRLDALVGRRALFEFKCADKIHPRHRAQVLNYLFLTGLDHGKLFNTRTEQVEHEFVNCDHRVCDRRSPEFVFDDWNSVIPEAETFVERFRELILDWGTGLELALYQDVLAHVFQGLTDVLLFSSPSKQLGVQPMHLVSSRVAFKLTAFSKRSGNYVCHAKRLLEHTNPHSNRFHANLDAV